MIMKRKMMSLSMIHLKVLAMNGRRRMKLNQYLKVKNPVQEGLKIWYDFAKSFLILLNSKSNNNNNSIS